MKKYILLLIIATSIYACKEDKFLTYNGEYNGIYFQRNASVTYASGGLSMVIKRSYVDSIFYNFAGVKQETKFKIESFPVKLMGNVVNYDRKINYKVNTELTTGIEGVDFEINYDTTYLKAGQSSANILVKFFRTSRLRTEQVRVALDLAESNDLKLLMNSYYQSTDWRNNTEVFNANIFKFVFTEKVVKPRAWPDSHFGTWTIDKYNILNDLMEWTATMWANANNPSTGSPIAWGTFGYAAFSFQEYLQNKADAGTPVKEEDGSFMQLAGVYIVDYSKYE